MKIIERGRYDKKFNCKECGCVFEANFNEYELSDPNDDAYIVNRHVRFTAKTKCPSCSSRVEDFVFLDKKEMEKLMKISSHVRRIIDEYYDQRG